MKIYLDDERFAPEGWDLIRHPGDCIALINEAWGEVEELSLDHDLGPDVMTGYDVLCWIEEQIVVHNRPPFPVSLHTANPIGRQRMNLVLVSLNDKVEWYRNQQEVV